MPTRVIIATPPGSTTTTTRYRISIDNFRVTNTRSRHNDDNVISLAVKVGDHEPVEASERIDGINNGTHSTRVSIDLDSQGKDVSFCYLIVNKGHSNNEENARKAISEAAKAASSAAGLGPVGDVVGRIVNAIFANCDGIVAQDRIVYSNTNLVNLTGQTGKHSETRFYPGSDSPEGCGSNSEYYVTWTITRL
ncbi:hypothetical protein [Brevibacillus laterosporus]|uniref:hypothetical protein n=1 Tax=Brevibacillus laterosporus TaxID=1465 RepID=UPI000EB5C45D|nr:hypothetical protein [Brevibacillus laterosporus]AYK07556.1 hypothetical protein D8Z77_14925 [Brevibacillus laterosporus]